MPWPTAAWRRAVPTSTAPDQRWAVLIGPAPGAGAAEPELAVLGGKGAQTARLVALGLPVPCAGVVTADAYRAVARDPAVAGLLTRIDSGEVVPAALVDRVFAGVALPDGLADEILALGAAVAGDGTLAVRSSATVEDLAGTSFAGQYRSVLGVEAGPDLLVAVRAVWASLWHPAPCAYRRAHGVPGTGAAMAVLLMRMVPASRAGVVFTADPGGRAHHLRVEAVAGLGEALVSGAVTPDAWVLSRRDGPREPAPVGEAVALALEAERGFGAPLDVEWAWDGARTWLVQARPITVEGPGDGFDSPVDDHDLTTAGISEMLPGVLPPLTWQLAGTAVEEALRAAFDRMGAVEGAWAATHGVIRRVRGRAALDLDVLRAVAEAVPGGSPEAVEHGFFGTGPAPAPSRAGRHRRLVADLRADAARRRALAEAAVVVGAVERLDPAPDLAPLDRPALLARRRRLVDLGFRAMAAEVGVAAAATAGYEHLTGFLGAHLPSDEAGRWAQRVTVGAGGTTVRPTASMSVFAGPTWDEAGTVPPLPPAIDEARRDEARRQLEQALRHLPRWRATRIMTGQVVDVRLHLVRRLVDDATALLRLRERAKVAVLDVGGLVRAVHRELGRRLTAEGLLPDPGEVDLLTDAELRGVDPFPGPARLARRRRAQAGARAAGSLPERFRGLPPPTVGVLPAGDRITGVGASGGRWTGRARAVRDPASGRLRTGEVLVAETTDAGWSPLFVEAGAIVVERGGPLSHAAIVARELGMPAVLAAEGAMAALDGHVVTVDGDEGVVVVHHGRPGEEGP